MCPQHKLDTLKEIKRALKKREKKIICVSTQVVEAGVNFSFGCVIRSKAGLDNVIQAAGRCNRHKELGKMGAVYIVQMSDDAEYLEHLQESEMHRQLCRMSYIVLILMRVPSIRRRPIKFHYSALLLTITRAGNEISGRGERSDDDLDRSAWEKSDRTKPILSEI